MLQLIIFIPSGAMAAYWRKYSDKDHLEIRVNEYNEFILSENIAEITSSELWCDWEEKARKRASECFERTYERNKKQKTILMPDISS